MSKFDFDLVVIGSGDAGGEAAISAAKNGMKVALIESGKWGGASLNYSNIPLGALFHATQTLRKAKDGAMYGISSATRINYNYPSLCNWRKIASHTAKANSKKVFEDAGIICYHGVGRILSKNEVSVDERKLRAKNILIATGASILDTGIKIQKGCEYLLPSSVINISRPPKSICIVGAGSTGCEFAQYFSTLGSNVVLADIAGRPLPREDEEVGQVLDGIFNDEGIKVLTQSRVIAVEKDGLNKRVIFLRGGKEQSIIVNEVLLCTGSAPRCDVGLENAGVKFDRNGIKVDPHMRTNVKNIFAAGDVVGGHSSTEKSSIEARVAVEHIAHGRSKATADYRALMHLTDTYPQVARVGMTEDDCLRRDRKIDKVVIPLAAAKRSAITGEEDGFIKLICDKRNKHILGGTIMCPNAGLVAQELVSAVHFTMSAREFASTPRVATEWSELIKLACDEL